MATRGIVVMLVMGLSAVTSSAQSVSGASTPLSMSTPPSMAWTAPRPVVAGAATTAAPPEQRPSPPVPTARAKRRPSMVGYVGDSTIADRVRVRFDSGFDLTSPDRAEFFYAKCGCYRDLPSTLDIADPDAAGPGPGIMSNGHYQQLFVQAEYAVSDRLSVFGELPLRWLKPQEFVPGTGSFDNQSGLSDLRAGAKLGLVSTDSGQATAMLQVSTPTGDARKGLGVGFATVEAALLGARRMTETVGVEGQFGAIFPMGGSPGVPTRGSDKFSGSVLYYGLGPSVDVYTSDTLRVTPVVELVGWRVLGGFQTLCDGAPCFADAGGTNIVNLKIGARAAFGDDSSVYVGYGKGLTDEKWYGSIFRLEFRYGY